MKKITPIFRTQRGIALLTAMFLGTLLILTSVGVQETVVTGLRGGTAWELSTQAYYAASSGLRHAMHAVVSNPVGFNESGSWTGNNGSAAGVDTSGGVGGVSDAATVTTVPSATWEVVGRIADTGNNAWRRGNSNRFLIPYPGSGDAGDETCSFRNAVLESGAAYANVNDPCNWGKLGVGEAVAIPLYVDDPDSDDSADILNPVDLFRDAGGTPELRLKLRTDCDPAVEENEEPESCQRARLLWNPEFEGTDAVTLDLADGIYNDTIVLWEIVGECTDGDETEVCVLQPNAKRTIDWTGKPTEPPNTEITEEIINLANGGINSFAIGIDPRRNFLSRKGKDVYMDEDEDGDTIRNFLGIDGTRGSFGDTINKPVLKLSLVHSLQREGIHPSNIPYLEWQIESNALFASPKSFITATGRAGSFVQTLTTSLEKENAEIDFVIQN